MLADILELYATYLLTMGNKPLVIKGRLNTTSEFDVKVQSIQGKQARSKDLELCIVVKHFYNVCEFVLTILNFVFDTYSAYQIYHSHVCRKRN
jgi:hypothetical protein